MVAGAGEELEEISNGQPAMDNGSVQLKMEIGNGQCLHPNSLDLSTLKKEIIMKKYFSFADCLLPIAVLLFASCSSTHNLSKQADKILIADTAISKGFIGISVYDPAANKYLYNYNADKYFVPASNTKLFTLYAGMKYLGDSLVGLRYKNINDTFYLLSTGDPSFLYEDFKTQPVDVFFQKNKGVFFISDKNWKSKKYGKGWTWDDYGETYMAERSAFPIGGNTIKMQFKKDRTLSQKTKADSIVYKLKSFPDLNSAKIKYRLDSSLSNTSIQRIESDNTFIANFNGKKIDEEIRIPFVTNGIATAVEILNTRYTNVRKTDSTFNLQPSTFNILHSQPSDSLFKPMMHRSDNFFAEQTLLMASNEFLGYMSDEEMIDTILKTSLRDAPQKPKWVDGSGLSRYNLFTPKDFIYILNKMKNEFGMDRMKNILATGGEGTLKNYFIKDVGFIYAKTGTIVH